MVRFGLVATAVVLALAGPAAAAAAAAAAAENFDFVCRGKADDQSDFKSAMSHVRDRMVGRSSGGPSGSEQQFRLIIEGDTGRVQAPTPLTPGLADGGTGSWTRLSEVWVRPGSINASWTLNQLNSAHLALDLRDGRTDIDGGYSLNFHGFCRPAPVNAPPHP